MPAGRQASRFSAYIKDDHQRILILNSLVLNSQLYDRMKKSFLYLFAWSALMLVGCSENEAVVVPPEEAIGEVILPADAVAGELLVKFKPEMSDVLDMAASQAGKRGGVMTRSGIPATDEVLEWLGGWHLERVFPVDNQTEARTRAAGLHLWYLVKFDEEADLQVAAGRLSRLGEVSKVQGNPCIKRVGDVKRTYVSESAMSRARASVRGTAGIASFTDPGFAYQWNYHNTGVNDFDNRNDLGNGSEAGCDVGCLDAWKKCTGDPSIIVAVLDEGVMNAHPDLADNIWVNEGEELYADADADGNGYKDDKYGYNFVKNTGVITWSDADDSGHGTHIAGTIAAVNNNGMGVCGIAGGDGTKDSGVKIMSCQVFANGVSVSLAGEARAIKYAADNGAVILQCSWGYNSADANIVEGFSPGPGTEEEWENLYPLEKEAIDYFIENAGSPNGVIDGGLVVFASGNEYSGISAFPGAYHKCLTVGALAADFTPASYTNYGVEVDVSAPGGDTEYYGPLGMEDPEFWDETEGRYSGSILSTLIRNGQPAYGYMDGSSMACPHVVGVCALGLSHAVKLRRHFTAPEFATLLKQCVKPLDTWYMGGRVKTYYKNHNSVGGSPTKVPLSRYIGKMGTGLVDATLLLDAIEGAGREMKVPDVYVSEGGEMKMDLARFFVGGESLSYTCEVENISVASAVVNGSLLTVSGRKAGVTCLTVRVPGVGEQTVAVTVRGGADSDGWM